MGALRSEFVFVGSADGNLRAFRSSENTLTPAGFYQGSGLSFFALGRQTPDGGVWVFVSARLSVTALLYSPSTETFRRVAEIPTAGSGTHLAATAVDLAGPACHFVFLAHYHQHAFSAFRHCERDGFSEELVIRPGEHPHQAKVRGPFLYVPCLGSNYIAQYRTQGSAHEAPQLQPLNPPWTFVPGGPRHMALLPHEALSPHLPKAFVLCELESRLELLEIDSNGALRRLEEAAISTHPDAGAHWSSDVAVRPDGAFAYAINRDPPELVAFALAEDSVPHQASRFALSAPVRSFDMAPDGSHLQVGGEDGILRRISIAGEMSEISSLSGLGAIRHTEIAFLET